MADEPIKIGPPSEFSEEQKLAIVELLKLQRRVVNPSIQKLNACKFLGAYISDGTIISVGAIKPKTVSDFGPDKADLGSRLNDFEWELGYCYTDPDHTKKGYSSGIVRGLISKIENSKLIASTETNGSPMRRILERNGFKKEGKTWNSSIHGGELGLFLKENL